MLPIKIINCSANKYQLAKLLTLTKNKDWLLIYPLKRGNLPPGVNLPQIKKCCYRRSRDLRCITPDNVQCRVCVNATLLSDQANA